MAPSGNDIRRQFIEFFRDRGHTVVPSASLVPERDPSLLFTNAGMVQFKHVFLGSETRPYVRAVDVQKCLRVSGKHNDLEDVGRDDYHHTFFEMLGNWSFGDYGKREAIAWAWELLTAVWRLPKDRLRATVHVTDDEAARLWREITDVGAENILRFESENFWEMAEAGPCGPCSEIHIDRGAAACDGRHQSGRACGVNAGCARYLELWNLVFIQFNRGSDGTLAELPVQHVDTGMGLERITAVLQGVRGNYEGDLLREVIRAGERVASTRFGATAASDVSLRVIADHARAGAFLVADGVLPSNEGRGYVLRRLLRRAARHGKLLGVDEPFLYQVTDVVARLMGEAYPELALHRAHIGEVIRSEEERFAVTLDRGLALLEDEMRATRAAGGDTLPGAAAFRLYDTYGFPLDLTEDIVRGERMRLDHAGFERCMTDQRERARGAQRFRDAEGAAAIAVAGVAPVRFVGDRVAEWQSEIRAIAAADGAPRAEAGAEDMIEVITAETPFYAEGGGQVGDTGRIETTSGAVVEVTDTQKRDGGLIAHRGRVLRGALRVGDVATLRIDAPRRDATRLNHSATHILHAVLRERLGGHVRQAGSLVTPDRLRFDFSHHKPIDADALAEIEARVNAYVRENAPVTSEDMAYDEAIRAGALAFFGDAYGERVRVIRMGGFSTELCGGTHVARTGDIGVFKVRAESGVAAGTRRVEAVTGIGALEWIRQRERLLRDLAATMKSPEDALHEKIERLLAQQRDLERRLAGMQARLAGGGAGDLLGQTREAGGVKLLAARVDDADADGLRGLADRLRERIGSGVVLLGAVEGERVNLVAAVTPDLVGRLHAGRLVKEIAAAVGGSGGGRPDFAQAGGRNPAALDSALATADDHVRAQLAGGAGSAKARSSAG
jgi:alanyl-tRNA synthetase